MDTCLVCSIWILSCHLTWFIIGFITSFHISFSCIWNCKSYKSLFRKLVLTVYINIYVSQHFIFLYISHNISYVIQLPFNAWFLLLLAEYAYSWYKKFFLIDLEAFFSCLLNWWDIVYLPFPFDYFYDISHRTRYFSTPRKGHNPLQGRAYYQLLECLGVGIFLFPFLTQIICLQILFCEDIIHVYMKQIMISKWLIPRVYACQVIRIHSPMRAERKQDWSDVPSRAMISRAHAAALRLRKGQADQAGDLGQFGNCKVWGNGGPENSGPISGSPDMSDLRRNSNYSKWEAMPFESLRREARDHYFQMEGVSMYKMDGNKLDDLVCVRHSFLKSKEWTKL